MYVPNSKCTTYVGLLIILTLLRFSSAKLCLLSSTNLFSWIVSIRMEEFIRCTGSLINENYVIAPVTCFEENVDRGFYEGRKFKVIAGREVPDKCRQERQGRQVIGHPRLAEDRYRYSIAWLEVEPFSFDKNHPPLMILPNNEESNVQALNTAGVQSEKCQAVWVSSGQMGMDYGENALSVVDVSMMPRYLCWRKYCPSGNEKCVAYFWESDLYACTMYDGTKSKKCFWESIGAPLICKGTVVGLLKSCYDDKPLMIQGFNKAQLEGIEIYRQLASEQLEAG